MAAREISSKYSKVDLVVKTLRKKIENGDFPSGSRLPGIRKIAQLFDVSRCTVNNGLGVLEKEGFVARRAGSGAFVTFGKEVIDIKAVSALGPAPEKFEKIAEEIANDISSGAYKVGNPLPLKKALRYQLGTSPTTLNSALSIVEEQGLIHRKGTTFIVGPRGVKRNPLMNRVYMLPAKSASGGEVWGQFVDDPFSLSFTGELSDNGVIFLGQHHVDIAKGRNLSSPASTDTLGFTCFIQNPSWVERVTHGTVGLLEKQFERFNRIGLPVVLFRTGPVHSAFPQFSFRKFKNLYPFGLDNVMAAKQTSQYLKMMGHENIAFFSYSDHSWNAVRLRGAKEGAEQKGKHTRCRIAAFQANVSRFPLREYRGARRNRLKERVTELISAEFPSIDFSKNPPIGNILTHIRTELIKFSHGPALNPFFEEAFSDSKITAWICADPEVTVLANRFLAGKGFPAPKRISLISIDDYGTLYQLGITACNFRLNHMGYLAAHSLLGDIPIKKDKCGLVECPPTIIERGSVRRV